MAHIATAVRGLFIMIGVAVLFIAVLCGLLALIGHGMDVRQHSVVEDFWDGRGIGSDGGDSPMAIRLAVVTACCAGLLPATAAHSRRH